MMIQAVLLLPALVGLVFASSEKAKVYIWPQPKPLLREPTIPTLPPEEVRLIIAQRLGVSQYHSLNQISGGALAHINTFGGQQTGLFEDDNAEPLQLVIIADNISPHTAKQLETVYGSAQLAFEILEPPSQGANAKLVKDISTQGRLEISGHQCSLNDAINPSFGRCWTQNAKIVHLDGQSETHDANKILESIPMLIDRDSEAMHAMVILMPKSSHHSPSSYGIYDSPSPSLFARNAQVESPIESTDANAPLSKSLPKFTQAQSPAPAARKFASCYETNESCNTGTRNCSGHGACYAKISSPADGQSCYTCGCKTSIKITKTAEGELTRLTHWGGPACQKEDISGPFWLLLGVSVVLVGVVAAGIGMLFSVGEEKLPGVIGAGVSGPKAR